MSEASRKLDRFDAAIKELSNIVNNTNVLNESVNNDDTVVEEVINMAVEKDETKLLGEMVGHVEGGIDPIQLEEVPFNPLTQDVVLDVHVASALCGLLGACHCRVCIILFI